MASTANLTEDSTVARAIKLVQKNKPSRVFTGNNDLAELVLENAFFVAPSDRKHTSARLLALNAANDKALVEVY
jgi:hypothetical protein